MLRVSVRNTRKAVTFVELLVASSMTAVIMMFVTYVIVLQGKEAEHIHSVAKAEGKVHIAAEMIRYSLIMGKFGSVSITDNGHTIQFNNPNLDSGTNKNISIFQFSGNSLKYYHAFQSAPTTRTLFREIKNITDVTFTPNSNKSIIGIRVKGIAKLYNKPDVNVERSLSVYLRN